MPERRTAARERIDETALIALDEHTSVPCLIYDLSDAGVRVVAPEVPSLPTTFLLSAHRFGGPRVCRIVWRHGEEIGARFEGPPA